MTEKVPETRNVIQKLKAGSTKVAATMKDLGRRAGNTFKRMDKPARILVLVLMIAVVAEIPIFLAIGANRAPVITAATPTSSSSTMDEGESVHFNIAASDPDGNLLSYQWLVNGAPAGSGVASFTFSPDHCMGGLIYAITASVSDGTTKVERTWSITVTNKITRLGSVDLVGDYLHAAGNKVFFLSPDSDGDTWICVADGNGANMVKEADPYDDDMAVMGDLLYFLYDDGSGTQLWVSDGTYPGTMQVTSFDSSAYFYDLFAWKGHLYFSGYNDDEATNGDELWISDGNVAGTHMLANINPGTLDSNPSDFLAAGNYVYFTCTVGGSVQFWRTDGTAAGTIQLLDHQLYYYEYASYLMEYHAVLGSIMVFCADGGGGYGYELWVTDGTPAGTKLITDIYPGSGNSNPDYFAVLGNVAYFKANNGTSSELWRTDGTAAGTYMVKDVFPGGDPSVAYLTRSGDYIFFRATDGTAGTELWRTDGTAAGTVMVNDINPTGSSNPDADTPDCFGVAANLVVFEATVGSNSELWASDGTAAGTFLVQDMNGGASFSPEYFVTAGNAVYFFGSDSTLDTGLYIY